METSMTATSGHSSVAFSTASAPSAASPMTHMSASASMSRFNPSRTTAWSSAKRMCSLAMGFSCLRRRQRNPYKDGRALTDIGFHLHFAVHQRSAFLHAQQPEPFPLGVTRHGFDVETFAIVLNDNLHLIGPALDDQTDAARAGMLENVGERFLHDPIGSCLDRRGQALPRPSRRVKINLDVGRRGPLLDVVGEGAQQPQIVERGRPQFQGEVVNLLSNLFG